MAAKRSPSRSIGPKGQSRRSPSKPSLGKRLLSAIVWVGRLSRPRSAIEVLALFFVLLSIALTCAVLASAVQKSRSPGIELVWAGALLIAAGAARTSFWWRSEIRALTPERGRLFSGSILLVSVALVLSLHLAATDLGLGGGYVLPGVLGKDPWATAVMLGATAASLALLLGIPVWTWAIAAAHMMGGAARKAGEARVVEAADVDTLVIADAGDEEDDVVEHPHESPVLRPPVGKTRLSRAEPAPSMPSGHGSALPAVELFAAPPKGPVARVDLQHVADRIQETLASFNVAARVVDHHSGPVVTQFDIQPERGVKVKSITALQNDLALALAAPTIRIQAPVPGKPVVGIEIPNASATLVTLRELLESDTYRTNKSPLRVPLGKDVAGGPVVIDLAKMPHLLIAGATGSGKSACVNALISSLLYQNTPEQVRLMMVDPKMVELAVYNGVPHLLSPVVTQMDKVVGVLQWAMREMERRYLLFAETTVRNITRFNEKADSLGLKKLPFIVLVIDELADLMMVAPEEVEDAICRIAQLARAAGIHLIIATQRPSVDVVTGLIKANFPARIAFAMTSQIDSRTILDCAGAEKLLGRGDMLYLPPDAPKPVRLQGPYVSDAEIERLVEFWQRNPLEMAVQRISEEELVAAAKAAAEEDDELLGESVRLVREHRHASVSLLQRRLRVGYSRAARLMDQLEARGVVGPADGAKQRPVLDEHESETAPPGPRT